MTPEEFLQQLNPHSKVFDLSVDYRYTEYQMLLFAKLYHESELKKLLVGDVSVKSEQFYCVSSDSLVNGKSCEKWCGNPHCKDLVKQ